MCITCSVHLTGYYLITEIISGEGIDYEAHH
jgi:hypothetical protein